MKNNLILVFLAVIFLAGGFYYRNLEIKSGKHYNNLRFRVAGSINQAKNWGDGISPKNLKAILVANFNKIRVIKYSQENSREIDDYGYNVLAVKK